MPVPALGASDVAEALRLQSTWATKHCQAFENDPSADKDEDASAATTSPPPGASAPNPEPDAFDTSPIVFSQASRKFSDVTFRSRFGLHGLNNDSIEPYMIQSRENEIVNGVASKGFESGEAPWSRLQRLQKEVAALGTWVKVTPGQRASALEGPEGETCKIHSMLIESQLVSQEHAKACKRAAQSLHSLGPKARRVPEHMWVPSGPNCEVQALESLVTMGRVDLDTSSSTSANSKPSVHYKLEDPGGIPWRSCEESERLHNVEARTDHLKKLLGDPSGSTESDLDQLAHLKRRLEALDRVADDGALGRLQETLHSLVTGLDVLESSMTESDKKKKTDDANKKSDAKTQDSGKTEEKQPQDGDGDGAPAEDGKTKGNVNSAEAADEKEQAKETEDQEKKESKGGFNPQMTTSEFAEDETPEHKISRLYEESKTYAAAAAKVEDFVRESMSRAPLLEEIRQFIEDIHAEEVKNAHLFMVLKETKEAAEKMQERTTK
eukprot:gnl/MRDRNA2_/MRDRNA2_97987_c0_seq1.p1 gnl/MRDRNA2_/MRDRNA2_97987_c0~~gnl/MRDRNA2_/MRDRNA2_97987_c0_seq1.p1  ORF type:complete len:511 (+),score=143.48 gnl/MRDRNA2_/MRDRNA2_97987_c0_seq1:49-1533(+)